MIMDFVLLLLWCFWIRDRHNIMMYYSYIIFYIYISIAIPYIYYYYKLNYVYLPFFDVEARWEVFFGMNLSFKDNDYAVFGG